MARAEIEIFLILLIKVSLFWVAQKKRRKDSFLTLISKQISFCVYSRDSIIYANKGCNDIIFDYIIYFEEFKFVSENSLYADQF